MKGGDLEKIKLDLEKMQKKYMDCENAMIELKYDTNKTAIELKYEKEKTDKQVKILGEQVKKLKEDLRLKTSQLKLYNSKKTGGEHVHKCIDYEDSSILAMIGCILFIYVIFSLYICPY